MRTGVYRADRAEGLLELRVEPGELRSYLVTDGTPELGYVADCVTDDASTVTCTERDGYRLEIVWSGTSAALEVTLPGAPAVHKAAWEGSPWVRVP